MFISSEAYFAFVYIHKVIPYGNIRYYKQNESIMVFIRYK